MRSKSFAGVQVRDADENGGEDRRVGGLMDT